MTISEARAALRRMGRRVKRLPNGRYVVQGVWPDVRECDLPQVVQGLEAKK
jgi:hypothetical protein